MPKMTLDEAVKVLREWDRKHRNKNDWRWWMMGINNLRDCYADVYVHNTSINRTTRFRASRPEQAILAAARWAKKEMEKKR